MKTPPTPLSLPDHDLTSACPTHSSPIRSSESPRLPLARRLALITALAVLGNGCANLPGRTAPPPPVKPAAPVSVPAAPAAATAAPAQSAVAPAPQATATPPEPEGPPRKEVFFAVTTANRLVSFNAGQPGRLLSSRQITGLRTGEEILGIDYRVAKGVLYALGRAGDETRLLTIDTAIARATEVGNEPIHVPVVGHEFGFDFNPTVDRIRVVSDIGLNLRLHPDTGQAIDTDPKGSGLQIDGTLAYDAKDINARRRPAIVAAAYTYNKKNEKITTNFAIDRRAGTLVLQGSREGAQPGVSPNTGRLFTVGPLGAGPIERASFDIADLTGAAFAAVTRPGGTTSRFYLVDLGSGKATYLGLIGGGEAVRGISYEP